MIALALALLAQKPLPVASNVSPLMLHDFPRHEDAIRKVYAAMPLRGRNTPIDVYEINAPFNWDSSGNVIWFDDMTGSEYSGFGAGYNPEIILQEDAPDAVCRSFAHKFGHVAYWRIITTTERNDWLRFWQDNPLIMPRLYAQLTPAEGFAEAFLVTYLPNPVYPLSWGYPPNYVPDAKLVAKMRSIMGVQAPGFEPSVAN